MDWKHYLIHKHAQHKANLKKAADSGKGFCFLCTENGGLVRLIDSDEDDGTNFDLSEAVYDCLWGEYVFVNPKFLDPLGFIHEEQLCNTYLVDWDGDVYEFYKKTDESEQPNYPIGTWMYSQVVPEEFLK